MKKIFFQTLTVILFFLGIALSSSHKVEAAVTASITANGAGSSLTVPKGTWVNIAWSSIGATSCSNNFNSSTATSGTFGFSADAAGSYSFNVNCTAPDPVPTTTVCYLGFWQDPDPVHPNGGTVQYTGADDVLYTESGIWDDRAAQITYKTGTTPRAQGAHQVDCATANL